MTESRKPFPGKRPAVKEFYDLYPLGTSRECVLWIRYTYNVVIRSKRVSTIRKQLFPNQPIPRITITKEDVEMSQHKQDNTFTPTDNVSIINTPPESNGSQTKQVGGGAKARLTHLTFYKVCEVLKEHKQRFLDERPNQKVTAQILTDLSNIEVSENSIPELKEATGINWETKYASMKKRIAATHAIRTLATAVIRLYKKHKEEVPSALVDLYEEFTGRRPVGIEVSREEESEVN